jgi:O-6-methylguanine DNA methyltransferase
MSHLYDSRADVTRFVMPSPVGPLGLVSRNDMLAGIFFRVDPADFAFLVERTFGNPGTEASAPFAETRRQLEEYFAGRRLVFRLPLDLEQGTAFQRRVWRALLDIPYGHTMSYKEVAMTIGQPSAVRAVGAANGANPIPIVVPCHRVVASDGTLGGYGGGLSIKRDLLDLEGNTRAAAVQLGLFPRKYRGPYRWPMNP